MINHQGTTRVEAAEVATSGADAFLSGNRTCELGMEHATARAHESARIALERATRPRVIGASVDSESPEATRVG